MSQENETDQSEADILRQELDTFFESIIEIESISFKQWRVADKADELMDAANNFNQHNVTSQLKRKINEIENWYIDKHNTLIRQVGSDKQIAVNNWLLRGNDFLLDKINVELSSLITALAVCKSEMTLFSEYYKESSGLKGIINVALMGLTNPIDGLMSFIGQSSVDKEAELFDKNLRIAFEDKAHAFDMLIEKIDDIIINKWNNELLESLAEIENFLPSQANVSQAKIQTQSSPILGFIIAGIVVGVVIVVGIGLLRYFGLF